MIIASTVLMSTIRYTLHKRLRCSENMSEVHKLKREVYLIFRTWKSLQLKNIKAKWKGLTFYNHFMLKMNAHSPLFRTVIFGEGAEENSPVLPARQPRSEVINLRLRMGLLYLKLIIFSFKLYKYCILVKKKKKETTKVQTI